MPDVTIMSRLVMRLRSITRRPLIVLALVLVAALAVWIRCGRLPAGLLDRADTPSTVVLDRRGERLYEARSPDGLRADSIDASRIPPVVAAATMAAEDERFRWHPGVDPIAIARAALHDVRAGRLAEGGSTLTQQVADLLLARLEPGPRRRGWRAKLGETLVALRLEHRRSKNDILALYLDLAPYGNQIAGIERAAQAYFGRASATLTPAEAAFLAALPQQPSRFNPWRDPARARARQRRVLEAMAADGWLSPAALSTALAERLTLTHEATALVAPHFVERVLASVQGHPRAIETTLDATLQRTIHGIIDAARPGLDAHHASNVAVAVLDNRTGEWLAWEGSGDYFDADHGGTIDGVVTPRQPGSALKPFTYAAAFERGFTPGHRLADVPSEFATATPGVLYSPRNYDGIFRGPLLARAALAGSENVPAVVLASEVGVPAIVRLLRRAGFTSLDANAAHYGLGLTLGNAEVRLDELVAGYAMIARGGERIAPRLIRAVDGTPRPDADAERVISARTAFWLTDILSDADARAYIFGRGGSLDFPFPVAAKTGTSQSYFDNWVVGYTRDVTVGVWVGNFDRTPLRGSSGVTGAGPIFHDVMLAAVERVEGALPVGDTRPILAPTPDVHRVELCAMSGMRATDACPTRVSEWMPAGADLADCTWHHATDRGLVTVWPEAFRGWARAEGLATPESPPDDAPIDVSAADVTMPARGEMQRARQAAAEPLTIRRPLGGAVFLIDPTLRPQFQQLSLSARGGAGGPLTWSVDGTIVGHAAADETLKWPLVRGRHEVVVRDAAGASARTRIEVR